MFRPLSPGHHQVTSKQQNLRKLDTVIYKTESHRLKIQRDLVVVILYGSIYNQYKIAKM
jgi:phage gp45-like